MEGTEVKDDIKKIKERGYSKGQGVIKIRSLKKTKKGRIRSSKMLKSLP